MADDKIVLGLGACLDGQAVRFNGQTKRPNQVLQQFSQHFQFRTFCPEVGIGMGVPREPIRLVGDIDKTQALDSRHQRHNYTRPLQQYAQRVLEECPQLAGYVLVKGSPSCGLYRVTRYGDEGQVLGRDGRGVFAAALAELDPLLPLEEDGRLQDPQLRESFVCRVYARHRWLQLQQDSYGLSDLIALWAQYKYLVMARDYAGYRRIGQLLANRDGLPLAEIATQFIALLMAALQRPVSRRGQFNALQHVKGYLKKQLDKVERDHIDQVLLQYRQGTVPLIVPVTLLQHAFERFPNPYMQQQLYLSPYPDQLSLRNQL